MLLRKRKKDAIAVSSPHKDLVELAIMRRVYHPTTDNKLHMLPELAHCYHSNPIGSAVLLSASFQTSNSRLINLTQNSIS